MPHNQVVVPIAEVSRAAAELSPSPNVSPGQRLESEAIRLTRIAVAELAKIAQATARLEQHIESANDLTRILVGRVTDPTHLSISEAAHLNGVTTKTIRNWIKRRLYTLEEVPGTKRRGIPVREITTRWAPALARRNR